MSHDYLLVESDDSRRVCLEALRRGSRGKISSESGSTIFVSNNISGFTMDLPLEYSRCCRTAEQGFLTTSSVFSIPDNNRTSMDSEV